jgi:hypothetical protein
MLAAASYLSLTVDETIAIDNCSYIAVHCYVLQDWICFPILLHLQKMESGNSFAFLSLFPAWVCYWWICHCAFVDLLHSLKVKLLDLLLCFCEFASFFEGQSGRSVILLLWICFVLLKSKWWLCYCAFVDLLCSLKVTCRNLGWGKATDLAKDIEFTGWLELVCSFIYFFFGRRLVVCKMIAWTKLGYF